jgi:hypothetical protein
VINYTTRAVENVTPCQIVGPVFPFHFFPFHLRKGGVGGEAEDGEDPVHAVGEGDAGVVSTPISFSTGPLTASGKGTPD